MENVPATRLVPQGQPVEVIVLPLSFNPLFVNYLGCMSISTLQLRVPIKKHLLFKLIQYLVLKNIKLNSHEAAHDPSCILQYVPSVLQWMSVINTE